MWAASVAVVAVFECGSWIRRRDKCQQQRGRHHDKQRQQQHEVVLVKLHCTSHPQRRHPYSQPQLNADDDASVCSSQSQLTKVERNKWKKACLRCGKEQMEYVVQRVRSVHVDAGHVCFLSVDIQRCLSLHGSAMKITHLSCCRKRINM